jgi:hypothetical protein
MILTWSLKTFGIPIHHTYFTKNGSPNSMNFYRASPLCFDQTSLTKDYGPVILDLVAMGWNTSFTNLLEQLPPQPQIAGSLESSTPSCKHSQVNLTWLTCLNYRYIVLVYGILEYPYTGLKPEVLLPHTDSLHHLTSPYYSFGWLKFIKTALGIHLPIG